MFSVPWTVSADQKRSNRRTATKLAGLTLAMFGFGYALVPLYSLLIAHELLHPGVRGRHVIQNQIGHQPSALGQGGEITPITETLLKRRVAGHRKTAITGGLQKRQHMNHRCEGLQMAIHKRLQRLKSRNSLLTNGVGVGDQDHITTVPAIDVFCHIAIS